MKMLSRGTCLALALVLLVSGFSSPLSAADSTVPPEPVAGPPPPAVKGSTPDGGGGGGASIQIPGVAFRPRSSSVGFAYGGAGSMYAISNPSEWWTAPVYLPQGAVVTAIRMYYFDGNAASNCSAIFDGFDSYIGDVNVYVTMASSGSPGLSYADHSVNITIDNSKYSYALQWQPNVADSSIKLYGFHIVYTPPPVPNKAVVIPLN